MPLLLLAVKKGDHEGIVRVIYCCLCLLAGFLLFIHFYDSVFMMLAILCFNFASERERESVNKGKSEENTERCEMRQDDVEFIII